MGGRGRGYSYLQLTDIFSVFKTIKDAGDESVKMQVVLMEVA